MKQEAIWEYYQNEALESFDGSLARLTFLAKRFKRKEVVLNIGIGGGNFEEAALTRGIDVHSLDPSERSIESLRDRLGMGDKAKVGYSQEIPFPDSFFDGLVMSEILEHLSAEVIDSTLNEVHRVLAPGGCFLGTVPANEDLREQTVFCPHCCNRFHRWGHLQSFDRTRIRSLLSDQFQVEALSQPDFTFAEPKFIKWRKLNWKGKLHSSLKACLWRVGVRSLGKTIYFRATKR